MEKCPVIYRSMVVFLSFLVCVITLEVAGISYQYISREQTMTPQLQSEFDRTKQLRESLQKRAEVLRIASAEEIDIVPHIDKLAAVKPSEIKLTRVDMGETGVVSVEGFTATLPNAMNTYVESINREKGQFANGQLERMTVGTGDAKVFVIKVAAVK